jgi:hypothetical protein
VRKTGFLNGANDDFLSCTMLFRWRGFEV